MSLSFYSRLYNVSKNEKNDSVENFFTEIIAKVLNDTNMLIDFFDNFSDTKLKNPTGIKVDTQIQYSKLKGHDYNSRPDIIIKFRDDGKQYTVFIENKIESREGNGQLPRYNDQLKNLRKKGHETALFYITKYHDQKEIEGLIQKRWYKIYDWLCKNRNLFIDDVIAYMEELGLNQTRNFELNGRWFIYDLKLFKPIMDECIDGPVKDIVKNLFVDQTELKGKMNKNNDFYYKQNWTGKDTIGLNVKNKACTFLEYGFQNLKQEHPDITVMFVVNNRYYKLEESKRALEWFLKSHNDWKRDNSKGYTIITCKMNLSHFLKQDDNVSQIQKYIKGRIEEIYSIKEKYPHLDWRVDKI